MINQHRRRVMYDADNGRRRRRIDRFMRLYIGIRKSIYCNIRLRCLIPHCTGVGERRKTTRGTTQRSILATKNKMMYIRILGLFPYVRVSRIRPGLAPPFHPCMYTLPRACRPTSSRHCADPLNQLIPCPSTPPNHINPGTTANNALHAPRASCNFELGFGGGG